MSWILITNDDGVDSPAIEPLARAMETVAEVEVLVPASERSWIGKALSRHDEVTMTGEVRNGRNVTTCSGYPADCVQLGVHHLRPEPPTLIVSGVNIGYNHGAGFLLGSGTVGAAIEGWASGVPSVAFSTGSMEDFTTWRRHAMSDDAADSWDKLGRICAEITADLLAADVWRHCDVVNVNLPAASDEDTPRWITDVARVGYDALFDPRQGSGATDTARFDFARKLSLRRIPDPSTADDRQGDDHPRRVSDVDAARASAVSITPVRLPVASDLPTAVANGISRHQPE